MTRPIKPKWIAIAYALKNITANSVLDDFAAADLIEDGLRRDKLRARAVRFEVSVDEADSKPITPRTRTGPDTPPSVKLDKSLFVDGRFGINFFEELSFSRHVTFYSEAGCVSFDRLEIHRKDFQKHIRNSLSWDIDGIMKGRPRKEVAWALFLIKMVRLERENRLNILNFPESKFLLNEIRDELEGIGIPKADLDERTIKPYIEALWNKLVCEHDDNK